MIGDYTITVPNTWDGNYIYPTTTTGTTSTIWYSGNTIYMYQIFCPKRSCKKANWLQLDKPQACHNCGSILKAVSEKVDFEVEVSK